MKGDSDSTKERDGVYSIVMVTCPAKLAEKIAREVLSRRVAACVNVVSRVRSLYRWKGEVQTSSESLLLMKTRTTLVGSLEVVVKGLHPYEVPEIITLPIARGNPDYLNWIADETTG